MSDDELLRCLLHPVVAHRSDEETGTVILLKPRFGKGWLGRFFTRHSTRPHVQVHLDELGSWVWSHLNDETPLGALLEPMGADFPELEEPARRLVLFARQLAGSGFVTVAAPVPVE